MDKEEDKLRPKKWVFSKGEEKLKFLLLGFGVLDKVGVRELGMPMAISIALLTLSHS